MSSVSLLFDSVLSMFCVFLPGLVPLGQLCFHPPADCPHKVTCKHNGYSEYVQIVPYMTGILEQNLMQH